jgi:hypothetical protein
MKKPLLIVSENEVVAAADAALDALKKEAEETAKKFAEEFEQKSRTQWKLIEVELVANGLMSLEDCDNTTKMLSIENGVVYFEEKSEMKITMDMVRKKIEQILSY